MPNSKPTSPSQQALLRPKDVVFQDGATLGSGKYLFVAHNKALLNKSRHQAHVVLFNANSWSELARFKWQAVGLVVCSEDPLEALVLGRDGQVGRVGAAHSGEERIDPSRALGPMRGIAKIDDVPSAFGMQRHIYRRNSKGKWERFDRGMEMPIPKGKFDISAMIKKGIAQMGGINAVVQGSPKDVYAFGMRGEIWRLKGSRWEKVDSPTDVMLTDATEVSAKNIMACGIAGTLVKGQADTWMMVSLTTKERCDFSSIAAFKGVIYLADGQALHTLQAGKLKQVDFGVGLSVPVSCLRTGHGSLLAIAGSELFITRDGHTWTDLLLREDGSG
jgi:hypothetical protein